MIHVVWFAYGILRVIDPSPANELKILYLLVEPTCTVRSGEVELTLTNLPLEDEHDGDLKQGTKRCLVNEVVRAGL